jgi:hypothetical protein
MVNSYGCLSLFSLLWQNLERITTSIDDGWWVMQENSFASKPQKIKALNIYLGTKCQNRPGPINYSTYANGQTGVTGFSSEAGLEFADGAGEKKKRVARCGHTTSGRDNGKCGSVQKNESPTIQILITPRTHLRDYAGRRLKAAESRRCRI